MKKIMEEEPKDVIVLGAIRSGAKKFDKIVRVTKIKPDELNKILEKLEGRGLIEVKEKKGFFGSKVELNTTEKGSREIDERIHELQEEWSQMVTLYKTGDKKKLKEYMDERRSFFPTMMYFGIIDMMMFSMMFSMMGIGMSDFFAGDPQGMEYANDGDVGNAGDSDFGDGGFDIDIGF
tara:strand:- start:50 stop:583 length:534 start_codon:yes stop_codon:yes gene_type:complete